MVSKSDDLEMETQQIQCPTLLPGQQGDISITFIIPGITCFYYLILVVFITFLFIKHVHNFLAYPGAFNSTWNFYTQDDLIGPPLKLSLVVSNLNEIESRFYLLNKTSLYLFIILLYFSNKNKI